MGETLRRPPKVKGLPGQSESLRQKDRGPEGVLESPIGFDLDRRRRGNTLRFGTGRKKETLTRDRGYSRVARFTPHTEADVQEMLEAIGVETLDDLFADVSPKFEGELDLPEALSEYEALREVDVPGERERLTGCPSSSGRGLTTGSYPPPSARSSPAAST